MNKPIIIAAGPVIIENGKVLLNKHGEDNFWKFPGGQVESFDITLEEAAKREVLEEMGLEVELIRPLKPMIIDMPEKVVVLIHYLASRKGEVKTAKEILAWDWFGIYDLPVDSAPNIHPVVEEYLKSR